MRTLRAALTTLLVAAVLVGTAFAAGLVVHQLDQRSTAVAAEPTRSPESSSPAEAIDAPSVAPAPEPLEEAFRIEQGDRGNIVRELQYRLFQLAWWPELTTGTYDAATVDAVRGFQDKRGIEATGVVDRVTWDRLRKMTEQPTHDQMFNILHPGPAIYAAGASGDEVRDLQARLKQIEWLFGDVTGTYDDDTVAAVKGFQKKREIPVTGEVDQRTWDRLAEMTSTPTRQEKYNIEPKVADGGTTAGLDPRCTTGRAICIDKSTNSLRWVVDGEVKLTMDARFGSTVNNTPTREGQFAVYRMHRQWTSTLYGSEMPFAMFFDGGQAVHYSSDFAANGYNGASHGCVNIRDWDGIEWLFSQVEIGDKVVVYWS